MMAPSPHPPRLARRLLRHRCHPAFWEELEGDLLEQFRHQAQHHGLLRARLTYWRDALLYAHKPYLTSHRGLPYRHARGPYMLQSYFKIALRRLRRHSGYTVINVSGLAVGLACCLLILFYVQDELSYDRFHEHADRLYRVGLTTEPPTGVVASARSGPGVAPTLLDEVPEIVEAVRFWAFGRLVQHEDQRFQETLHMADASLFDVFDFPLAQGDPTTALLEPYSLLLTEAMAAKYFGEDNPLGQTLHLEEDQPYTVTGVLKEIPSNSHLQFDFLVSMATLQTWRPQMETDAAQGWGWAAFFTYVLLDEGAAPAAVQRKLDAVVQTHTQIFEIPHTLHLEPLTDLYLHSTRTGQAGPTGNVTYLYIFSLVAAGILLIACVNFMNLATARAAKRAKEVGVRKMLGALRSQLVRQFLGESMLLSLAATTLAAGLALVALPLLNTLSGKTLTMGSAFRGPVVPGLLALGMGVGLLSGSYPALFLSRYQPARVLKGALRGGLTQAAALRKGLVVFQFALSIALLVGTAVVYQQLSFMRDGDLGFEKEQMVILSTHGDPAVARDHATFRQRLAQQPGVAGVTFSQTVPGRAPSMRYYEFEYQAGASPEAFTMNTTFVDVDFFRQYGIEVIAGRDFSAEHPTDRQEGFFVNEAAVEALGWATPEEAVGKRVVDYNSRPEKRGEILGVVKDFHYAGLQQEIEPLILMAHSPWYNYISVRAQTDDLPTTLAALETAWNTLLPNRPFAYFFLDEDFDRQYRVEQRFGTLFSYFAALAILIACLGLFGLATFTAEQRTKEIGIRKVLGASITGIILLLSREFAALVGVAFVVATPVAYIAMTQWLEAFAYRIDIGLGTFLLAAGLALGLALLTVSYHALKTALANPIETLRYE